MVTTQKPLELDNISQELYGKRYNDLIFKEKIKVLNEQDKRVDEMMNATAKLIEVKW